VVGVRVVKVVVMEKVRVGRVLELNKILEEWMIWSHGYQRIFRH
jgi:hypothetical protein